MKVSTHPLYHTWNGMVRRCRDSKNINYPHYGGRGIDVLDEWAERGPHGTTNTPLGFLKFLKYVNENLGEKPNGCSLDRIDNTSNYVPGNIRWANHSTQNTNRRCPNGQFRNIRLVPSGKYQVNMWHDKKNYYVGTYSSIDEALSARDSFRESLMK